jgi:DNA polymerase-3 subunit gamma/tau
MSEQRYLVAARKYRPQLFRELVAQEHVTETLKNALRLDRLGHAYLFSGPRGVGKTTAARLLAKAINCQTPLVQREDGAEPCRRCEACLAFEEGRSLNVFEIDAASNNRVEDVRELRETVRVPPQGARKKVYIIDEVHMLSNAAFNALLKTLEEPPPHVLFIFATTEPHKVLPTILSRCQRFDFRRIPVEDIVARLREICAAEGVEADDESLILLARKGDGALRDALSAFDQAVSLCGPTLRYAELAQALGVVDIDLYFEVTEHVRTGNGAGMLQLVERIVRAGYDLQEFVIGLAEHVRNLLIARTLPDLSLIEAGETTRRRYAQAAEAFTEADLLRMLGLLAEAETALKQSAHPRLRLELALLRLASLPHAVDLRRILEQLDRLAQSAPNGPATPSSPASLPPEGRTTMPALTPKSTASSTASQQGASSSGLSNPFGPPALRIRPATKPGEGSGQALQVAEVALEAPEVAFQTIVSGWADFVHQIKQVRIHVGSLLEESRPLRLVHDALQLAVPDEHAERLLRNQESFLIEQLHAYLQETTPIRRIRFVAQARSQVAAVPEEPEDPLQLLQRLQQQVPALQHLMDRFGCEPLWQTG